MKKEIKEELEEVIKEEFKIILDDKNNVVGYVEIGDLENSIIIKNNGVINKLKKDGVIDEYGNFLYSYSDEKLTKLKIDKEKKEKVITKNLTEEKLEDFENRISKLEEKQ